MTNARDTFLLDTTTGNVWRLTEYSDFNAYDRWAPVYDLVFGAVFERGRRAAIDAAERVGGRILEVGVGTGISLPDYSPRQPHLRHRYLRADAAQGARARHRPGLRNVERLAVMDAEQLTFPDDSFDVVVAQYVVTTVPHPEATLDEFARVLKPGGEIVLVSRVGAEAGLRRTLEHWFAPAARSSAGAPSFPGSATRAGSREHARHAPDRAPPDAAARALLADPLRQDR